MVRGDGVLVFEDRALCVGSASPAHTRAQANATPPAAELDSSQGGICWRGNGHPWCVYSGRCAPLIDLPQLSPDQVMELEAKVQQAEDDLKNGVRPIRSNGGKASIAHPSF
jgi:hypothetical protein